MAKMAEWSKSLREVERAEFRAPSMPAAMCPTM